MRQTTQIREWLARGNRITSAEAFEMFGSTRLSAIVFELRKRGMRIETRMETGRDRYGNQVRYASYGLAEEVVE